MATQRVPGSAVRAAAPTLLSVEQAAKALGVSRALVHRMIASGELPSLNIARRRLLDAADLARWVDARKRPAA